MTRNNRRERKILMLKKTIALISALLMVLSLASCKKKDEAETTAKAENVMATQAEENEEVTEEAVEEETELEEEETTEEEASDVGESEDETEKAETETTKKSENKTTTKADESMKIPSTKKEIVNAYKAAANKTKAQQNINVDKTGKVEIVIDKLMSMEIAGKIASSIVKKYMTDWDGKTVHNEVFVNGKPTKDLERTKDTFIPLHGEKEMCTISPDEVASAKVTKVSKDSYQIEIKLKGDSSGVNDKPPVLSKGMDYFDTRLYGFDDIGLAFLSGTVKYSGAVIRATINADGYVEYIEHKMDLKSTDSKIAYQDFKIPGYVALHGSYFTTFTFK